MADEGAGFRVWRSGRRGVEERRHGEPGGHVGDVVPARRVGGGGLGGDGPVHQVEVQVVQPKVREGFGECEGDVGGVVAILSQVVRFVCSYVMVSNGHHSDEQGGEGGGRGSHLLIIPQFAGHPDILSPFSGLSQSFCDPFPHFNLIPVDRCTIYVGVTSLNREGDCFRGIVFVKTPSAETELRD